MFQVKWYKCVTGKEDQANGNDKNKEESEVGNYIIEEVHGVIKQKLYYKHWSTYGKWLYVIDPLLVCQFVRMRVC